MPPFITCSVWFHSFFPSKKEKHYKGSEMLNPCYPATSTKALLTSPALFFVFFPPNPRIATSPLFSSTSRFSKILRANCTFAGRSISDRNDEVLSGRRNNYSGVRLEETVAVDSSSKLRLDSWISSRVSGISRARVQFSIRSGLVTVNGRIVDKVINYSLNSFCKIILLLLLFSSKT